MRVLPREDSTRPRWPREKSYWAFIGDYCVRALTIRAGENTWLFDNARFRENLIANFRLPLTFLAYMRAASERTGGCAPTFRFDFDMRNYRLRVYRTGGPRA